MKNAELERECERLCERVNARRHRVTRRAPAVLLAEERERLHPLPGLPHTVCFGQTRRSPGRRRSRWAAPSTPSPRRSSTSASGARRGLGARRRRHRLPPGAARGRPPRADHAGPAVDLRRALPRPAPPGRSSAAPGRAQPRRRRSFARAGRRGLAGWAAAQGAARARRGCGGRWPRPSPGQAPRLRGGRARARGPARRQAASARATWPRSSPITARAG